MPRPPRTQFCRLLRRSRRPGLALVLVLAQAAASFGAPAVRLKGHLACTGCAAGSCGQHDGCCCEEPVPAPKPVDCGKCGKAAGACCCTELEPEPEPDACPKCRAKAKPVAKAAPAPVLVRIIELKRCPCRGESPAGVLAEVPALPVTASASAVCSPPAVGTLSPADHDASSHVPDPLDPPPWR